MVDLDNKAMGRGKINFIDVLDKYECWKVKCVKSIVGEFCSGVSTCPNKGPQSGLGASFNDPCWGYGGTFLWLWINVIM